ncbi:hybrid sensor histidine kinase/response regulator [Sinorhizobium sp. NFACC03]|uniref:hybrid sensor histidine kinase/response regulator n=1 Tax=Sinorhizobium sp. NFACC03 TaxID=1566295 RepID=UPI0008876988|nr:hybrid sensor histidine kinase/response regulator [Sinorhizobium sp. NFACC03]SDA93655.1 Signal transduction histidine kinase [Sinorhizobium sp. NFACC03]
MTAAAMAWQGRVFGSVADVLRSRGDDAERGQALVRLVLVPLLCLYVVPKLLGSEDRAEIWLKLTVAYLVAYIPVSVLLYRDIVQRPGQFHGRRLFGMANDYFCMLLAMAVGGAATLPVYATLLWVTLANGLRFGPRYLIGATAAAFVALGITYYFNSYWRENPDMVLTLVLTTTVVPAYVLTLITRIHKAYHAAMEANLAKSRFLAQASHDLRQPIHAISLFTSVLRDAGLGPREVQMVDNIDRSLESVSRLFKSLLDVSTLDSGRVTLKVEPVAVQQIIDDVVRQNSQAAQRAGVELRPVASTVWVETDPSLLATILQNVVNNAIKYAPGRPVVIGCRRRGQTVSVEVLDCGPGIAAEHQPHVFEEFYQVRERGDRDVEGVGLGLPIVKRLANLLGHAVALASRPGHGTRVALSGLPIAEPQLAEREQQVVRPASAMDGLRVLLVEDDEAVLRATASLLESWGCEVDTSTTIPETFEDCDLLITDYDLGGGVTGKECIGVVRNMQQWNIPVVVMSGHDADRVRDELGDPDIPLLTKPVRPAELRSVVLASALDARA